jgi:hypothetical protein
MRVLLKLVLDCTPDAAWRALTSPDVFQQVAAPLMRFRSLEAGGFPRRWSEGVHPVQARVLGAIPIGEQTIDITFLERRGARIVRDTGRGLSGPLAIVSRWEHSMAVSAAPGGRTLYRDQLVFDAEPFTPVLWPLYWTFWQARGRGIRSLAKEWS